MGKKALFSLFFFYAFAGGLQAIELTLEENKAESGTIGYVDIEKVFRKYSVKSESREKFLTKIKEKEDILEKKKELINSLEVSILKLKQEKQLAETLPGLLESARGAMPQTPDSPAKTQEQPLLPGLTQPVSTPVAGTDTVKNSTETTKEEKASQTPGGASLSEGRATDTVPSASSGTAATMPTAGIDVSTNAKNEKIPVINMPGVGSLPLSHFKFSVSTDPAKIEEEILRQEEFMKRNEEDLKKLRKQFDRELADYEDLETEKILGNIYLKLKELSVREGVSVVVDKKSILFGHRAVDLTDKLITELEENR